MATYTFEGQSDNTDLSAITDWSRVSGNSGDIVVMADGKLDYTVTGDCAYRVSVGHADMSIEATIGTATTLFGLFECCVRLTDSSNFVGARLQTAGIVELYERTTASGFIKRGEVVGLDAHAPGDILKLSVVGNTYNVYYKGALVIGPTTITVHSSVTYAGVMGRSDPQTNAIDAITITNLGAGTSTPYVALQTQRNIRGVFR